MRPLGDVRIIAVEQYGAGPFGTVHLADLGADVIKIEDPRTGGDIGRYVPPHQIDEDSLFHETFNRNKRSLSLELTNPAGREVFEDLVRVSDAVYSNLRGDVPAKLRILYEDLEHLNPAIVCCSLTGFGMTGPRRQEPGYDYVIQGLAGWMSLCGEPDGPPTKTGLSLVDYQGGFIAALALMCGLHAARRDGKGMDCDISLFEGALGMLTYPATWYLSAGDRAERLSRSSHPSVVPFMNFPTKDGWIVIACPKDKFWQRLAAAIGKPDLGTDPRFANFAQRRANKAELVAEVDEALALATTSEWVERLEAEGVPCAPINDLAAALDDPQTLARGMVVETEHPKLGTVRQVRSPVNVACDEPPTYRVAPTRNGDAPEILGELLGYDHARIDALAARGAFGEFPDVSTPG